METRMKTTDLLKTSLIAGLLAAGLAGCQADGDGSRTAGPRGNGNAEIDSNDGIDDGGNVVGVDDDAGTQGNDDTGFPNDGSAGGRVDEGTATIAGTDADGNDTGRRFVCTHSAQSFFGTTTEVGANGLVGNQLSGLLDGLGTNAVTNLLNSVNDKELAIDGTLRTASSFTLTLSLLGVAGAGTIDSIDQSITMPSGTRVPAGDYAVFAVSFPPGILDLGLMPSVTIRTFLNDTEQEDPVTLDATALDLLGQGITGPVYAFIGRKVTQPYNRATISLEADLLAADIGDAMYVHELCTGGRIVDAPAP
jgi:hypothetical protein